MVAISVQTSSVRDYFSRDSANEVLRQLGLSTLPPHFNLLSERDRKILLVSINTICIGTREDRPEPFISREEYAEEVDPWARRFSFRKVESQPILYIWLNRVKKGDCLTGEGSAARVTECFRLSNGQNCLAIQRIARTSAWEWEGRVKVLKKVRSLAGTPGIANIYDWEEFLGKREEEKFAVYGELYEEDLEDRLYDRSCALTEPKKEQIILETLEGLAALHKIGIIHRDLNTTNIFLDNQERPHIGDFGNAGLLSKQRKKASYDMWEMGIIIASIYLDFSKRDKIQELNNHYEEYNDPSPLVDYLLQELGTTLIWPLLKELLQKDPEQRISAENALGLARQIFSQREETESSAKKSRLS